MAINYATIADIRNFGVAVTEAYDATVTTYLNIASRLVDDYCGQTFDPSASVTRTFNDVRNPIIPLPFGTTAVTAVTVNGGTPLVAGSYSLRTDQYGNVTALQLYIPGFLDVDGFPVTGASLLPPASFRYSGPTGSDVAVTLTLGAALPAVVAEATRLLTVRRLRSRNTVIPDSRIMQRTTDMGSTHYQHRFGVGLLSTGDIEVDRLLDGFNINKIQVA